MNDKIAELLLILLCSLGFLLTRGIREHFKKLKAVSTREQRSDIELQSLLFVAAVALVIVPLIDLFLPWLDFADQTFSAKLAWLGVGIGAGAVILFCWALIDSLRYREKNLLEAGLYRCIRHPFYTALLLWAMAQFLLLQNWLANIAALLTFAAMYFLRVPRDEQDLLERFGHAYIEYMERTGELWPRFPLRRKH